MRGAVVTLIALMLPHALHAQSPNRFSGGNGAALNSKSGGAAALSTGAAGVAPAGDGLTPTMRRERREQIYAIHAEVVRLKASNGGELSDKDQRYIERRVRRIVGNR